VRALRFCEERVRECLKDCGRKGSEWQEREGKEKRKVKPEGSL
jgi:hypothetical protein